MNYYIRTSTLNTPFHFIAFQVLAACLATAYAGVGVVTPEIEAEAYRLWQRYCGEAARSEGGNDGALAVYCKIARAFNMQIFNFNARNSFK